MPAHVARFKQTGFRCSCGWEVEADTLAEARAAFSSHVREMGGQTMPRYVVNLATGMIHDSEPSERCNTDDIEDRGSWKDVRFNQERKWRWCKLCYPDGAPENVSFAP